MAKTFLVEPIFFLCIVLLNFETVFHSQSPFSRLGQVKLPISIFLVKFIRVKFVIYVQILDVP